MRLCLAVVYVLLAVVSFMVNGEKSIGVVCLEGFLEYECPVDAPLCCYWPNRVVAACCPSNAICDLEEGSCNIFRNVTPHNGLQSYQSGIVWDTNTASLVACLFILCMVGSLILAANCGRAIVQRRIDAQERALERERLIARFGSDEEVDEDEDANESGPLLGSQSKLHGKTEEGSDNDNGEHLQVQGRRSSVLDEEERGICKICYCHRANCVLMECGHVCVCRPCAKRLAQCPMCRDPVEKVIKLLAPIQLPPSGQFEEATHSAAVEVAEDTDEKPLSLREKSTANREPVITSAVLPIEQTATEEQTQEQNQERESDKQEPTSLLGEDVGLV